MYEFPILWGTPQSMNPNSVLFVTAWAAVTVVGCVAFLFAMAAEGKNLRPDIATPVADGEDEDLHRAA